MDLTDMCNPQITKLAGSESKNHLIMASTGSLISAGEQSPSATGTCFHFRKVHQISFITGSADSEVSEEQKKEKVAELKKKEKDLQDKLAKKLEELKKICLREAVSSTVIQLLPSDTNHS